MHKNERETNMQHINKRQPLNYRLLTWGRHIHTECDEVNKQLRHERMIHPTSCVEVLCNNHK